MTRHFACSLYLMAIVVAVILQACGKPSPDSLDRPPHQAVDAPASRLEAHHGEKTADGFPAASKPPLEHYQTKDPPPWLAELFHAADPNVRIQALDALARQPTESLDPVTYALVDPDESVRVRAQEVLEQELARR